jgi:hypothetical protein
MLSSLRPAIRNVKERQTPAFDDIPRLTLFAIFSPLRLTVY